MNGLKKGAMKRMHWERMKEGIRNKMVKKGRFDFRTALLQPAYFAILP